MARAARRVIGMVTALGLVLAACGSDIEEAEQRDPPAATPTPTARPAGPAGPAGPEPTDDDGCDDMAEQPSPEPAAPLQGGTVGRTYPGGDHPPELQSIVGLAIADLAEHLGIDPAAISVTQVDEVTWSDASLGCPEPGRAYAQQVTDGLRILLGAGGATYDYRSGGFGDPSRCEPATGIDATDPPVFDLTEDGEIVTVTPAPTPESDADGPTEGPDPPDE